MNGFGLDDSDVDMCLLVRHTEEMDQKTEAIEHLEQVLKHLKACGMQNLYVAVFKNYFKKIYFTIPHLNDKLILLYSIFFSYLEFIGSIDLIHAKVPIIRFRDIWENIQVDLNCNNAVGIRNTQLLYCYSRRRFN